MRSLKKIGVAVLCLSAFAFGAFIANLVVPRAEASDRWAETITLSSGSAVTSTLKYSSQAALSCDGPVRYRTGSANTTTAVATDALLSNFDLPVDICLPPGSEYISLIRTGSTTVTCQLFAVTPTTRPCK